MGNLGFYEGKYYCLSNFSAHQVEYQGEVYMTAEHAYQAQKFKDSLIIEKIKNAKSAYLAREYGQAKEGRKEDFDKLGVMKAVISAKLSGHEDVRQTLLSTGESIIVKNHPDDYFWGIGLDGTGENMMGKIWMELRKELTH